MASVETPGLDNSPHARRIVQAILDLRGGSVSGARVLDLGSAHGLYTLDLARRGANTLGLEGRAAWIQIADAARIAHGLESAQFIQADARNIDVERYGQFDVTLCLGLLYHLSAEEAFSLIGSLFVMTHEFLVIDTQIALEPLEKRVLGGKEYFGVDFPEHPLGSSVEVMQAELGASLDSNYSFWFTAPSLMNMLGEAGFSSVFELKWPTEHVYRDGEFRVHEDYITIVALKGEPVTDVFGLPPREKPLERAPEDRSAYFLQRPWSKAPDKLSDTTGDPTSPVGAEGVRSTLPARIAAAYRALRGA